MLVTYPAIFKEDERGGYYIQFPDIEGTGTQGKTILEGIDMAEDYLGIMLEDYQEQQDPFPQATDIEQLEIVYPKEIIKSISVRIA